MSEAASATGLPEPTADERSMATLAHILQMVGGVIAPLIIFFIRRQSRFVSFHALQVIFLQLCYLVFAMVFMVAWFGLIFGTVFSQAGKPQGAPPPALFIVMPLIWVFFMLAWVTVLVAAIVYGIKANRGEWANYPVLGGWARRVLNI
jgi:uncharacterized protein